MNSDRKKTDRLSKTAESVIQTDIASMKSISSELVRIVNDLNSTTQDLEDIIKLDPPLSAKILRVANSDYYSTGQQTSKIEEAVLRIEFTTLKYIALGQKAHDMFSRDKQVNGYSSSSIWKHSVAVGLLGELIYNHKFSDGGEHIYAAGLLHDIGIIAEDQLFSEKLKEILKKTEHENSCLMDLEEERLGYNHAELGMALMKQWDFPPEMVMAIGFHHDPAEADEEHAYIVSILHVADIICQENGFGYCDTPFRDESAFEKCLERLDLGPNTINPLVTELKKKIAKIEARGFFS